MPGEELFNLLIEVYRRSRRPSRRIGYMRVKRVIGEVVGRKGESEAEGGGRGG